MKDKDITCEEENIILIRLGNRNRPATKDDIDHIKKRLKQSQNHPGSHWIIHHAISFEKVWFQKGATTVYKIGDDDRPASEDDLKDFEKELIEARANKTPLVTHHAVEVVYIYLPK